MPQKPPQRKGPPVPSGSNSALSSLVSAAPFIPTTSSDTSTPAGASVASANEAGGYSVGAAPFVPEGKKVSLRADSVNAVPFVPTEGSTAQQGRAQEPNTSELRHTAVLREHLFRPGGDVAVRSQGYIPTVQQPPMPYMPGAHPRRAGGRGRAPGLPFGAAGEEESFGGGGRGRGRGGAGKGWQGGGQYQHHQHHQQSDLGPSPRTADFFMGKGRVQAAVQFMAEQTRSELQQQSFLIHAQWQGEPALPDMIGDFHSLYPLENLSHAEEQASSALGVRTQALKGLTTVDGSPYVLRRIDGKQVVARGELLSSARSAVEQWSQLADHPGIVGLRSVMVSDELGGVSSLFFIYDYHPGSLTLEASHLRPSHTLQGLVHAPIREEVLWSYLVQLTATLMAVHSVDLHLRPPCLAPSKVLLAPNGHLRVNCCGITEALRPDASSRHDTLHQRQREDLKALGSLVLSLACAKSGSMPSLEYCVMHNSADFVKVVQALLAAPGGTGFTSWRQLSAVLHERTLMEMQAMHLRSDSLYNQLGKEYENGRLLRLLLKLGFINERPEFSMDAQWSETGDRYLLKLFRDFVFHSVQDDGSPVLDYGHVIECLNKLDAGIPEKILLLSRDEASMLVVSYADVKKCLETAFQELRTAASAASSSAAARAGMANRYAGGWTAGHR